MHLLGSILWSMGVKSCMEERSLSMSPIFSSSVCLVPASQFNSLVDMQIQSIPTSRSSVPSLPYMKLVGHRVAIMPNTATAGSLETDHVSPLTHFLAQLITVIIM